MQSSLSIDAGKFKDVAEHAAVQAGNLVRQQFSEPRQISQKGYRDYVTDADFASQAIITEIIQSSFPEHGFLTEEDDPSLPEGGPVIWVIDPIDGTTNYSRQIPTYCISIAAATRQGTGQSGWNDYRPVAGVIYDPMRDEMFSAAADGGSTLNGKDVSVSKADNVGEAIVSLDWSRDYARRQTMLSALNRFAHEAHTIRATGSAALNLAWIAAGRLDVYFNFGIGPWDVAAATVLIAQAGGTVTNAAGEPWSLNDASCVASNGLVHRAFLDQAGFDGAL
jgi:myo-inositol-1(or 4)-monophosphatase